MKNRTQVPYPPAAILLIVALAILVPIAVRSPFGTVSSFVENGTSFLVLLGIAGAVLVLLLFNAVARLRSSGERSITARMPGLALAAHAHRFFSRNCFRRLAKKSMPGGDVLLIGSTGFRTFVDPGGELHRVLLQCREARIMLLDPLRQGTVARARSIPDPDVSAESMREQIIRSIDFLKGLKEARKNIRLKLYPDLPLLKLAILGDYACVRHYHAGLNQDDLPVYLFRQDHGPGGLYDRFYQYFIGQWSNPSIPEYELETDELVYRDRNGNEVRRERFNDVEMAAA